ncbi:ATPase [Sphingomonas sp. RB56-2]|uniref:ATPase n=1 Tax=Sphingomonas brevis TaxID=2908206 RepID=A0ABT0S5L3_9SPHN|nr:ATPase [Sphingomonas brevis]MCL6739684.1 ATPase [Sphingomonas brevis]
MRFALLLPTLLMTAPASAEVISSGPNGFEVQEVVNLVVPQPSAYAAFGQVGQWWNKEHTYSGDSARLSLQLRPGGCFCEPLEGGGGVEHMRVAYLKPGEQLVMTGSLGPLLYQATTGVMDVKFERIAGGTRVTMNYRAAGFANSDGDKLAPLVDQVLADQMKRYRTYAAKAPKPDTLKP